MPYAWQEVGETREIPRKRSKRLNVLGFMSRENDSFFHSIDGSVTSEVVIKAFDDFAARYANQYDETQMPCVVILDNASIHHSNAVKQRANDWMQQGVFLHFLPPYSPELNLIEILWRKIKYEWRAPWKGATSQWVRSPPGNFRSSRKQSEQSSVDQLTDS